MKKRSKKSYKFLGSGVTRPFVNKRKRLMLGNGVTQPFINKRNHLMLGNGKKKQNKTKRWIFWTTFSSISTDCS